MDGQLGVAPSHCILGPWRLEKGASRVNRYRVVVTEGRPDAALIERERAALPPYSILLVRLP